MSPDRAWAQVEVDGADDREDESGMLVEELEPMLITSPIKLSTLKLWRFSITPTQITHLIRLPQLEPLRILELWDCGLGDDGVNALLVEGKLEQLTRLDLSSNVKITTIGAKSLAASSQLPSLTTLDLRRTGIDSEGRDALVEGRGDTVKIRMR